jgi:hypothetical protein
MAMPALAGATPFRENQPSPGHPPSSPPFSPFPYPQWRPDNTYRAWNPLEVEPTRRFFRHQSSGAATAAAAAVIAVIRFQPWKRSKSVGGKDKEVVSRMWDVIKTAIQSNGMTARFIVIITVLAAVTWLISLH